MAASLAALHTLQVVHWSAITSVTSSGDHQRCQTVTRSALLPERQESHVFLECQGCCFSVGPRGYLVYSAATKAPHSYQDTRHCVVNALWGTARHVPGHLSQYPPKIFFAHLSFVLLKIFLVWRILPFCVSVKWICYILHAGLWQVAAWVLCPYGNGRIILSLMLVKPW